MDIQDTKQMLQEISMPSIDSLICPKCQTTNPASNFYCLHCGKKLKEPPVSTSIGKQILMYSVSFLLPPFGLGWAFSYMRQANPKAKVIGWIILLLTTISLVLTIWITWVVFTT